MGQLLAVLIATVIMGLMAPPMMRLALLPVETARQKSNFSLAESNAIAVRKQAAASDSLQGLTLPEGCVQKANAIPTGANTVVDHFVECSSGEAKFTALAWQPLYLSSELSAGNSEETEGEANICYSLYDSTGDWQSDSNDKKRLEFGGQNVFRGTASELGRIALATKVTPGESVSSQKSLLLRVHDISDSECSKVDASVKPTLTSSGSSDDDDKKCSVPDYEGDDFDNDPSGTIWNKDGPGFILTEKWKKNREVDKQEPSPGDKVNCKDNLTLKFK